VRFLEYFGKKACFINGNTQGGGENTGHAWSCDAARGTPAPENDRIPIKWTRTRASRDVESTRKKSSRFYSSAVSDAGPKWATEKGTRNAEEFPSACATRYAAALACHLAAHPSAFIPLLDSSVPLKAARPRPFRGEGASQAARPRRYRKANRGCTWPCNKERRVECYVAFANFIRGRNSVELLFR